MQQRILSLCLLLVSAATIAADSATLPPMPALNTTTTTTPLPGKFIWADLFSSDMARSQPFYSSLFGWQWRWVSEQPQHPYGLFYNGDDAVAGLAHRDAPQNGEAYSRWIHFIAVDEVSTVEKTLSTQGGQILLSARALPQRGEVAVVADAESAPFGLLNSSSGDPEDYQAAVGSWIWHQLFSHNPLQAADFYQALIGYQVHERNEPPGLDYILASQGHSRAGIGALAAESESKPHWLGFIRVADIDSTVAQARRLGGTVLLEPQASILDGNVAIIADPLGAPIGLLSWRYLEEQAARP